MADLPAKCQVEQQEHSFQLSPCDLQVGTRGSPCLPCSLMPRPLVLSAHAVPHGALSPQACTHATGMPGPLASPSTWEAPTGATDVHLCHSSSEKPILVARPNTHPVASLSALTKMRSPGLAQWPAVIRSDSLMGIGSFSGWSLEYHFGSTTQPQLTSREYFGLRRWNMIKR